MPFIWEIQVHYGFLQIRYSFLPARRSLSTTTLAGTDTGISQIHFGKRHPTDLWLLEPITPIFSGPVNHAAFSGGRNVPFPPVRYNLVWSMTELSVGIQPKPESEYFRIG